MPFEPGLAATRPRAVRVGLSIPVRYRIEGEERWRESRLINISESGMLFGPAPLQPGVGLEVACVVPAAVAGFPAGRVVCRGEAVRGLEHGAIAVRFDFRAEPQAEREPPLPVRRVLVVEPDRAAREALAQLLEDAGYEVLAVGTVAEGHQLLWGVGADLLISALRVEGENGLQLVAMSPRRIPALIMSDPPDHGLRRDAYDLGAELLTRPVRAAVLLNLVREKLSRGPDPIQWTV